MQDDPERWSAVDRYFGEKFTPADETLEQALAANAAAGLPPHDVSPLQGKFLALMAKLTRAERVLEIGGLGGYSTIWLARALSPTGRVTSLELSPEFAAVAKENLMKAGVAERVRLMIGPALESLERLDSEGTEPFDLVFIDADKPNNPAYLQWALKLSRPGTLIIGDNVVRDGAVVELNSTDDRVRGVREFADQLTVTPQLFTTVLQTVGMKGWDGMTLSFVEG